MLPRSRLPLGKVHRPNLLALMTETDPPPNRSANVLEKTVLWYVPEVNQRSVNQSTPQLHPLIEPGAAEATRIGTYPRRTKNLQFPFDTWYVPVIWLRLHSQVGAA